MSSANIEQDSPGGRSKASLQKSNSGVMSHQGNTESQSPKASRSRLPQNPYLSEVSRRPLSLERTRLEPSSVAATYRLNKSVRLNSFRGRGAPKLEFEISMEKRLEETISILDNTIAFTLGDEGADYSHLKPKAIRKMDTGNLDESKDGIGIGKKKMTMREEYFSIIRI